MPPRVSWRNLLPGLIALATVISIAIGATLFGGMGRADTMRVYVLTDQAQGVMGGTEVWLAGQKIGIVERIGFRPPSADTTMRIVLVLRIDNDAAAHIRSDSRARIQPGGSIIGPAVLYFSGGTPNGASVAAGDTLRAQTQSDVAVSGARLLASMNRELRPLITDARTVVARGRQQATAIRGTFTEEHNGEVVELRGRFARFRDFLASATSGDGVVAARDVAEQARVALARADSIRALLNSSSLSLGRFRRDSTLDHSIVSLQTDLALVRARLASVDGNVGRLARDSAITRAITDAQRELTLLADDVRRRPRRYLAF